MASGVLLRRGRSPQYQVLNKEKVIGMAIIVFTMNVPFLSGQIVFDDSNGSAGEVSFFGAGNSDRRAFVAPNRGLQNGDGLFHSFSEFNVPSQSEVIFGSGGAGYRGRRFED